MTEQTTSETLRNNPSDNAPKAENPSILRRFVGTRRCPKSFTERELGNLTEQFHTTIRAHFSRIRPDSTESKANPEAYSRVQALLSEKSRCGRTWEDAYDAEQQIVHLYDDQTVEVELRRRMLEADQRLTPELTRWYKQQLDRQNPPAEAERRLLLTRLVGDLQWSYSITLTTRRFIKKVTGRTELIFILTLFGFLLAVMAMLAWDDRLTGTSKPDVDTPAALEESPPGKKGDTEGANAPPSRTEDPGKLAGDKLATGAATSAAPKTVPLANEEDTRNPGDASSRKDFPATANDDQSGEERPASDHVLAFVGLAGAFGASFSMMISLRSRMQDNDLTDLRLNSSWLMLFARVFVGFGAAVVFFYLIRSGLVSGQIFPDFKWLPAERPDLGEVLAPNRVDLAKLFIWCFLSGFSEQLVPNILAQTVATANETGVSNARTGATPERPTHTGSRTTSVQQAGSANKDSQAPDAAKTETLENK